MLNVTKSFKKLVAEAEAQVKSLTPAEVEMKSKQNGVTLIDLRDIRELKREVSLEQIPLTFLMQKE